MLLNCLKLFWTFLKIGAVGFGGGYAMLSMITTEAQKFSVTLAQIADLNALDMLVPGPIAINAATGSLPPPSWGRAGVGGHATSQRDPHQRPTP